MAEQLTGSGWPADWLNGWMAALGVLARSDLRLSFTSEPVPKPVFHGPAGAALLPETIAGYLPSRAELDATSIARPATPEREELPRNPRLEQYRCRASLARRSGDLFLGATMTDLAGGTQQLAHSPFDAAVPKGLTLWDRVMSCLGKVDDPAGQTAASLQGTATRVKLNGLGFDPRRVTVSSATDSEKHVDPVVELFAFLALPIFPVRAAGGSVAATRGWQRAQSRRWSFTWPVWRDPLSMAALDSLLDEFWNTRPPESDPASLQRWRSLTAPLGVFGCYGSVAYRQTGQSDTTRAYSSEELWMTI